MLATTTILQLLTLITSGMTLTQTAQKVGIDRSTVYRWAARAGVTGPRTPIAADYAKPMIATPKDAPTTKPRKYHRVSSYERGYIECARNRENPLSFTQIAADLGRTTSTIIREVGRHGFNKGNTKIYSAAAADHGARRNAARRARPRKLEHAPLREFVIEQLNGGASPKQISMLLKKQFPGQPKMQISHEAIYKELYRGEDGLLPPSVLKQDKPLRSGRTCRKSRSRGATSGGRGTKTWIAGCRLGDRPDISDRAETGHWEGDLVVGPDTSAVITLVERKSRLCLLAKLPGKRDSATVIETLLQMTEHLPEQALRTLTWDQGSEMAEHARFTKASGCRVFFCDPHAPWQRGSNEHLNGMFRGYYPKGTNFNTVSEADLAETQWWLNNRLRQVLDCRSPFEVFTSDVSLTS